MNDRVSRSLDSLFVTEYTAFDFFLQEDVLELLFPEDLLRFLASSDQIWHDVLSWSVWKILVYFELFLSKLTSNLVRESFELAETDSMVRNSLLFDHVFGDIDAIHVVRGDEDHAVILTVFNGHLKAGIVTHMSVFEGVAHWRFQTNLFCKFTFFSEVGSSDKFETQVVT